MPAQSDPNDQTAPEPDLAGEAAADGTDSSEASEAAVPLNRAERRGHGRQAQRDQPHGRGKVGRRTNTAQGPRMWSNRRGGS
jgi:hypothetical protein